MLRENLREYESAPVTEGKPENSGYAAELTLEEVLRAQHEILQLMGHDLSSNESVLDWIGAYSKKFRVLINGYDGAYDPERDTREASENRALFHGNPNEFYEKMKRELEEHH